jgi:hypothetical protein
MANIFETGSTQESVSDGVSEDIGVGVSEEPSLERYLYPPEDEPARPTVFREGMDIDTQAHPKTQFRTSP